MNELPTATRGASSTDPHDQSLRRTALTVSMLSAFLTPFMASSMNVAMPFIGKEFGLSAVTLSWVLTAYILAAAMLLVPFGRLADLVGRKKIYELIEWGELKAVKLGRAVQVEKKSLDKFRAAGKLT